MDTRWKEIACDMLESKLKEISSHFSSILWKEHNNRIWFQTKDDVIMEPDGIGFDKYKMNIYNRTLHKDLYTVQVLRFLQELLEILDNTFCLTSILGIANTRRYHNILFYYLYFWDLMF